MKPKIGMITLGVRDVAASMAFYREGLGFAPHNYSDGDDMVMFPLASCWLGIYPRAALAEDVGVAAEGERFRGFTLSHNVGSKAEVDAVFAAALKAGAGCVKTPVEVFWGGYSGYFADPDGVLWEVAFNPFVDLT